MTRNGDDDDEVLSDSNTCKYFSSTVMFCKYYLMFITAISRYCMTRIRMSFIFLHDEREFFVFSYLPYCF